MPDYLGNKANPVLAGLTGLGEGLFQGFLLKQKMNEEQRQFNERMAMQERQNSLLRDIQYKQLELSGYNAETSRMNAETSKAGLENDFVNVAQGDVYNKIGVPVGKFPTSLIDNWMQRNAPQKPSEYTTTTVDDNGKKITYEHIKGQPAQSGKVIGTTSQWEPDKPKSETDFSEPALVGEINGTFQALKSMPGDANDPAKAPIKANLMAKTESLMEASGLTEDAGHIWDVVKNGGDVEKAINIAQLARKKSFTPKQKSYLRLYFKTRNPK